MGRICYSLKNADKDWCLFLAGTRSGAAVEVRLDTCDLDEEEIREVFSHPRKAELIATCHAELPSQTEEAARKLMTAILAGADYVDIPLDFPENSRQWLQRMAMNRGTRVILSWHNYSATDPLERLLEIGRQAEREGADIIKIVTTARTPEDADIVLALYEHFKPGTLLAFAMGADGRESRFHAFRKGAPLLFVSPTRADATAPGQPSYGDLLPDSDLRLRGEVQLPASKSFAQRAILLAALTCGTTKLYDLTRCQDVDSAIRVAEALYADVRLDGTTLTVEGHQNILRDGLKVRDNTLHVGESGLLARLCIPIAGLCEEDVLVTGEKTLLRRKVDDHRAALRKLGLKLRFTDRSHLPVLVQGRLRAGEVALDGSKGSQMISGLLIALSQCDRESTVVIDGVTSEPYIRLTTYIASFFGLSGYDCPELDETDENPEDDAEIRTWYIEPAQAVTPVLGLGVERDWSAAAMFLAAGAVAGDLSFRKLDLFSHQSDIAMFDLLKNIHADICYESDKNLISVRKSILHPFFFDITDAPDLFAPLFVLASFAGGPCTVAGIGRLRNKESDRARTFADEFRKLGVQTRVSGDTMTIFGIEDRIVSGGSCSSHGDHRLAMALMVASLRADGPVEIDDTDCIAKSFPEFLEIFETLKKD